MEKYQNNYLNTDNISIKVSDFVKNKIGNNEINENQINDLSQCQLIEKVKELEKKRNCKNKIIEK